MMHIADVGALIVLVAVLAGGLGFAACEWWLRRNVYDEM